MARRGREKTQNGIETGPAQRETVTGGSVEAGRKPRTGLKRLVVLLECAADLGRGREKTQNGIETYGR